jgi:hypothetical protein
MSVTAWTLTEVTGEEGVPVTWVTDTFAVEP